VDITAPVALKSDVLIIPVSELDPATRKSIDCNDDDFALSRPRSRTTSTVIDPPTAALIEQFRKPRTIVEAVVLFSNARRFKPSDVIEDAYRLVRQMIDQGFMVAAGAEATDETPAAGAMRPQFARGSFAAGVEVLRVLQLVEDTEVYLARHPDAGSCVLRCSGPDHTPRSDTSTGRRACSSGSTVTSRRG
jgi:eukaryotic-like serine/threonine-protein kinase